MTRTVFSFFLSLFGHFIFGQLPVKMYNPGDFKIEDFKKHGINKEIPKEIEPQVLTALSYYPELESVKIEFRIKKRKTPLTSRPRLISVFRKKKNRRYVITISSKSRDVLTPILLPNLPYNAQVGVLGHELAHISDYNTKHTFQMLGIAFGMLSSRKVDHFEWNTDKLTIEHGLGYQLYVWSAYVRKALKIKEWQGVSQDITNDIQPSKNERYMNPETILKFIQLDKQYNSEDE